MMGLSWQIDTAGIDVAGTAYDSPYMLATRKPPSKFLVWMYMLAPTRGSSKTALHEAGLRKHGGELLARDDLRPDVRRHIEKYFSRS